MKETKVITEFGDTLQKAILAKKNDVTSFVWKNRSGEEVKLVDMSKNELQRVYDHANEMLYNKDTYTPGRYQVKVNIRTFIANCNAELLLRYLLHECNIDILKTNLQIIEFVKQHKAANNLKNDDSVTTLFTNLPTEFESVTLDKLIDACLDQLGVINRKMLSEKFIIAQGIWLTEDEKEELLENDELGNRRPWLDVIKERLLLNQDLRLRIDPKGFSYREFSGLLRLEPLPKISKLPTNTLRLLRDKVFVLLDADTDYHIERWKTIINNILQAAEYLGFELKLRTDDN